MDRSIKKVPAKSTIDDIKDICNLQNKYVN